MSSPQFTFLSLFAGCGGFDLGFTTAGYRCVSAFDADETPLQVHRSNLGKLAHCRDLNTGLPASFSNKKIDVLVAGPPCQGFSTAGKRDPNDPRNDLLTVPALVAAKVAPRVVIVENVLGVTAGKHRKHWEKLTQMLRDLHYRTCELRCNAVDHGVPQDRRRVLLLAWNTGRDFQVKLPRLAGGVLANALQNLSGTPNHSPEPLASETVSWRIVTRVQPGQKLCNVRAGQRSVHTWQIPEVYGRTTNLERQVLSSLLVLRRRSRLRDFGDADPVTASSLVAYLGMPVDTILTSLISKGYVRRIERRYDLVHTFNGKYRRLSLDKPSPTVDTRFGDHRYFVHPTEHRGFTVREAARLQGFPDDFLFTGSIAAQYRMIGNAVPPPLANCVASFVRDAILTR